MTAATFRPTQYFSLSFEPSDDQSDDSTCQAPRVTLASACCKLSTARDGMPVSRMKLREVKDEQLQNASSWNCRARARSLLGSICGVGAAAHRVSARAGAENCGRASDGGAAGIGGHT